MGGFDRPVQAFFSSDDNTAYVVNCGAECGGTQASVQKLDLTINTLVAYAGLAFPAERSSVRQRSPGERIHDVSGWHAGARLTLHRAQRRRRPADCSPFLTSAA